MTKQNITNCIDLTNSKIELSEGPHRPSMGALLKPLAGLIAAVGLVACASVGPSTPEMQVQQRASERWKALLVPDFAKAYGFSASGFKAVVKLESFPARMQGAVKWVDAEVVQVTCPEALKCQAKVRIDYQPLVGRNAANSGTVTTYIDETWLKENDQWWVFLAI